jgi:hypothetical protein
MDGPYLLAVHFNFLASKNFSAISLAMRGRSWRVVHADDAVFWVTDVFDASHLIHALIDNGILIEVHGKLPGVVSSALKNPRAEVRTFRRRRP